MSVFDAITRAYYPITYVLTNHEMYNMLCVNKEMYNLFRNNGFLYKVILDGRHTDFMTNINRLFSQLQYTQVMDIRNFNNPEIIPEFTRCVKISDSVCAYFNPMMIIHKLKYLEIDNQWMKQVTNINWNKVPNLETFIYTGTNAVFNGIENCKKLKNVILKKYYKNNNDHYSGSLSIPDSILNIKTLEYLITDADCTNKEFKSINLRFLVCKGINIRINNKYDLTFYAMGGQYETIKPGNNTIANKNGYHYDRKYGNSHYDKNSYFDWSINKYITQGKYREIIKMY